MLKKSRSYFIALAVLAGLFCFSPNQGWTTPVAKPNTKPIPQVVKAEPKPTVPGSGFSRYGRTLSVSIPPVVTLDSQMAADFSSKLVISNIQEGLYKFDEAQNLVPVLATAPPQMEDETSYLIYLRKGVYFHDGSEFEADAVVYTVDRLLSPASRSPYKGYLSAQVKSVKALDKYTIQVKLVHPYVDLGALFSRIELYPLSPKSVGNYKDAYGRVIAVGTGAFVFDEWSKKEKLGLKNFPRYWQLDPNYKPKKPAKPKPVANKGAKAEVVPVQVEEVPQLNLPYLNAIQFKFYQDESLALTDLQNRRISAIGGITSHTAVLAGAKQSKILAHPGLCLNQIYLNIKQPPLDNVKVRQALAYAIDRNVLVQKVFSGYALPAQSCYPFWYWAHSFDYAGTDYQPKLAEELLQQAGFNKQNPLSFELLCTDESVLAAQARLVVEQWAGLGIKAKLTLVNKNELFARLYSNSNGQHNFTAALEDWQGGLNPDSFSYDLYSSKSPFNKVAYESPILELMFYDARSAQYQAEKAIFYRQAEKLITSDVSTIYLVFSHNIWAYNSFVQDLRLDYQGLADFSRVWVAY